MKKTLLDLKIPTLIGVIAIGVCIWFISQFLEDSKIFQSNPSQDIIPQNLKATNITDKSFTVAFTTNIKSNAKINFGTTSSQKIEAYDNRGSNSYFSHRITASNLKPNTKYYFSIIVDGFNFPGKEKDYTLYTGPSLPTDPGQAIKEISGKTLTTEGTPSNDTLIYLSIGNSQTVSFLTDQSGNYSLKPVLRDTSLQNYFVYNQNSEMNLSFMKQNLKSMVFELLSIHFFQEM